MEACNQGSLPSFIVVGNNDKNKPSDPVSYLRGVRLEYQGTDYQMLSNGNLEVNGVIKTLPFSTGGDDYVTVTFVPQNKMVSQIDLTMNASFLISTETCKVSIVFIFLQNVNLNVFSFSQKGVAYVFCQTRNDIFL